MAEPDRAAFQNPIADEEVDPTAANTDTHVERYVSPLYRPAWSDREPVPWQERADKLHGRIEAMFEAIDSDGDGKLSREELEAKLGTDGELEEYLRLCGCATSDVFDQLDADHNGAVTLDEFRAILGRRGSNFTIEWLEEQIVYQNRRLRSMGYNIRPEHLNEVGEIMPAKDLGEPRYVVALLFSVGTDGPGFTGNPTNLATEECVELVQRMWKADLAIDMRMSLDRSEIILLVGIPESIMRTEAHDMLELRMRLWKTKGTIGYEEDYDPHYTNYTRHMTVDGEVYVGGGTSGEFLGEGYKTVWTSALQQQAIKHRMMTSGINVESRMRLPNLQKQLNTVSKRIAGRKLIRANRLKELLTAAGGFRADCSAIMGDAVELLAQQVLADSFFTVYPEELMWDEVPEFYTDPNTGRPMPSGWKLDENGDKQRVGKTKEGDEAKRMRSTMRVADLHMAAARLPYVTYTSISAVFEQLDSYHRLPKKATAEKPEVLAGPGAEEQFQGSIRMFFALHDNEELGYLKEHWADWRLMFKIYHKARPNECSDSLAMGHPDMEPEIVHMFGIPTGFLYQPIDEIRTCSSCMQTNCSIVYLSSIQTNLTVLETVCLARRRGLFWRR